MDEGSPLLVEVSAKMEHSNSAKNMRARAGTFWIIFIGSIFFILDQGGLPISAASGQAWHSVSTSVVSPPPTCCHSGAQEGRRATEATGEGDLAIVVVECIPCPSSSSGAGSSSSNDIAHEPAAAAAQQQQYSSGAGASSIPTKYNVHPCKAKDGFKKAKITEHSGHLGPKPPLWPVPLATGQWFTSSFEPCSTPQVGTCCWRGVKARNNPALRASQNAAYYEFGTAIGRESTALSEERLERKGMTRRDKEEARAKKHGIPVQEMHREEKKRFYDNWRAKHPGEGRYSRSEAQDLAYLNLDHVRSMKWSSEFTGADGRTDEQHIITRDKIMKLFFDVYKPEGARGGGIQHLLDHQAQCGDYIIGDTEFNTHDLGGTSTDASFEQDDQQDDVPTHLQWSRTYDMAIILVDCTGRVKYTLFSESNADKMPLGEETKQRAIGVLRGLDATHLPMLLRSSATTILPMIRAAKFVFWGAPEIFMAELSGRRASDRSDGLDVLTELRKVLPNCRPSGSPPFSLSQNILVPFLGIRQAPYHTALQDTIDEALTITTLLRGLVKFYLSNSASSAAAILSGPPLKKAKTSSSAQPTGVKATTKAADAASSLKLTSFFAPKPKS